MLLQLLIYPSTTHKITMLNRKCLSLQLITTNKKTATFLYTYVQLQITCKFIDINEKNHNADD